jgi:uncharacterized membrane protein
MTKRYMRKALRWRERFEAQYERNALAEQRIREHRETVGQLEARVAELRGELVAAERRRLYWQRIQKLYEAMSR